MDRKLALGDFQTPEPLANAVCGVLRRKGLRPEVLVEPSCGTGNLVAAALKQLPTIRRAYCVELQARYEEEFWRVVAPFSHGIDIDYVVADAFQHDFPAAALAGKELLILGNPPWATNAGQTRLGSTNIPRKTNVKRTRGIEAITGKGNFDIAEALVARVARVLGGQGAWIGMICKAAVIKNLVRDADALGLKLSGMEMHGFDSGKEFGVGAAGGFFIARGGVTSGYECDVYSLSDPTIPPRHFGWCGENFVSDILAYKAVSHVDGECPIEWRQGVKHDASDVMILRASGDGTFTNGLGEVVSIEPDVAFPIAKGSHLRDVVVKESNTHVIVTQASLSDDTSGLATRVPRAWRYLLRHARALDGRKSAIYRNRPRFCMFGVGDYAFKPYKVAVAGLYKEPQFTLVPPVGGRPRMLDDTCYYLSFDDGPEALCALAALNSPTSRAFLGAISFRESKRVFSKDILSRIDLASLFENPGFDSWTTMLLKTLEARGMGAPTREELAATRQTMLARWSRPPGRGTRGY